MPKRTYVINCYLASLFLCLIPFMTFTPSLAKPLLLFSMLASGYCRTHIFVMQMIITENIDTQKHKKAFNIWSSLIFIGDPIVVFLCYSFLNNFNMSWQLTFLAIILIFALTTFLIQMLLPEVNMARQTNNSPPQPPQREVSTNK